MARVQLLSTVRPGTAQVAFPVQHGADVPCGTCVLSCLLPEFLSCATATAAKATQLRVLDGTTDAREREHERATEVVGQAVAEVPDRFRQIFYSDLSEQDYTRQLERAAAAQLAVHNPVGELAVHATLSEPAVTPRLAENFVCTTIRKQYAIDASGGSGGDDPSFGLPEARMYSYFREYCDVFHSACTGGEGAMAERLTLLHGLNHVLRAKQILARGNERRKQKTDEVIDGGEKEGDVAADLRDSSLTNAKVLIVAPIRNVAYRCVRTLLALHGSSDLQAFHGKFTEEFGGEDDGSDVRRRAAPQPVDFTERFRGNTDDTFMVSISGVPVTLLSFHSVFAVAARHQSD